VLAWFALRLPRLNSQKLIEDSVGIAPISDNRKIKLLVESGANLNLKDSQNKTILSYILMYKKFKQLNLMTKLENQHFHLI
jgi:ankyrin repeat protein